jgi:alpha-L-arabinofuranosidase
MGTVLRAIVVALSLMVLLIGSKNPSGAATGPVGALQIAPTGVLWKVPVTMYGESLEEISHALDGGLYAQLVRNGTFKEPYQRGSGPGRGPVPYWSLTVSGGATASFGVDRSMPLNAINHSMRIHVDVIPAGGQVSVGNRGYYGVAVRPDTSYTGQLLSRARRPWMGTARISLERPDGRVLASAAISSIGTAWESHSYRLRTPGWVKPSTANRVVFSLQDSARTPIRSDDVWLTHVTLFPPTDRARPAGLRPDLMDMLAALHPTFLRIPGGNYLEGYTTGTRFPWKATLGPLEYRSGHPNSAWGYWSTDDIGLLEYLEIAQDLGAQPILALYDGYSVGGEVVPRSQYGAYVRDALEEIQYAIGGPRTKWGALRAADHHPRPFPLHYVEIGNEDNFDQSHSYRWRFAAMYRAIKARYPSLEVIASAGRMALGYFGQAAATPTGVPPAIIDDHYYGPYAAFTSSADRYAVASRRGPRFFVGELGVQEGSPTGDLRAAVGEAAFLTGLERNSDVVLGAAYAPLLANQGQPSRPTSLIGFNGLTSYGSPSYWMLRMFAANLGERLVSSTLTGATGVEQVVTKTVDSKGTTFFIQLVNTSPRSRVIATSFSGPGFAPHTATLTQLIGAPRSHNSLRAPRNVVPGTRRLSIAGGVPQITLPGYSVGVLCLTGGQPGEPIKAHGT